MAKDTDMIQDNSLSASLLYSITVQFHSTHPKRQPAYGWDVMQQ